MATMAIQQIDIQNKTNETIKKSFLEDVAKTSLDVLKIEGSYSLGLLLVDNKFIKKLNKGYRGIDLPTDVLSFSLFNKKRITIDSPDKILYLGDVIISIDEAKKQSQKAGCALESELADLLIHGILHIVGFTHDKENNQKKMDNFSQKIINKLIKKKVIKYYAPIN